MKKPLSITRYVLLTTGALLTSLGALAAEPQAPPQQSMGPGERNFDWFSHTQQTLAELKGKLNLAPGQMAAWDTWSSGVLSDAKGQMARMKDREQHLADMTRPWSQGTTPERMERGIERLRTEIKRMQEHLTQLEAAQARTKAFYDQLDTNQKTIFDLFWQEVHMRMAGEMEGMRGL